MAVDNPAIHAAANRLPLMLNCPSSYVFAGIVGDASHMNPPEGYHVSARDLKFKEGVYGFDYARDIAGGRKYPDRASAWDLHFNTADMILVTKRIIASFLDPDDFRLAPLCEAAGTTNGVSVHAIYRYPTVTDDPNNHGGWPASHTSHVHLSIGRDVDTLTDLLPVLDVICGEPIDRPGGLTVSQYDDLVKVINANYANLDARMQDKNDRLQAQNTRISNLEAWRATFSPVGRRVRAFFGGTK